MKFTKTTVFLGFLFGNFAYQYFIPDVPSYATAFERSYFQGGILAFLFIWEKLTNEI